MKVNQKPSTVLAPIPAVLVTVGDERENNVLTLAWVGVVNSDPPMLSISVRPSRHSYAILQRTGEFTVNLVTKELVKATDLCGVTSGRDGDKFARAGITRAPGQKVACPSVAESPVNIECKVVRTEELGSHTLFLGQIVNVCVEEDYLNQASPLCSLVAYGNGTYASLGEPIGTFGFSLKR